MEREKVRLLYVDSELADKVRTEEDFLKKGLSPESIKKHDEGMKRAADDDTVCKTSDKNFI